MMRFPHGLKGHAHEAVAAAQTTTTFGLIKQLSTTPVLLAQNEQQAVPVDPQAALQANNEPFFFRLERELWKVNTFYLQKEAELKLRLKTLLEKKRGIQARHVYTSKISSTFLALEEGFQQFGNDLNKLQQFVEINATAFSKILKKWDKASKSRTKELYLSRAVEVQPCFNRDVISELSDQATTSLLELGAWAEGEKINYGAESSQHAVSGPQIATEQDDTDYQLLEAVLSGNVSSLQGWITRLKASEDSGERMTRTFLAAINEAPQEALKILVDTKLVNIHSEDEINERNALHEAAISGREFVLDLALSSGVDISRVDVYGRIPLHYACIHGRIDMVRQLVNANHDTINKKDHDNFTPLIHAIKHMQVSCINLLLSSKARIDPESESDHVALNLACQFGSKEIVELLLKEKAKIVADAEGLFPQHHVARSGKSPDLLLLLQDFGANLDEPDKSSGWTPLFYAASEGNAECLRILLDKGAKVGSKDDKKLSAMYYAAWEGHLGCMVLLGSGSVGTGDFLQQTLLASPSSQPPKSRAPDAMTADPDGIPDLALPPPIIPLRRYGHNFLDTQNLLQIHFECGKDSPIYFYHDSKYPAARLTISSKSSDLIPRNVLLPIQEDSKTVSFHIDNLDNFSIDFDVFPTFGARIIAKTVALSSTFSPLKDSSGRCCLPLYDPRLRVIGQLGLNFHFISAFHGIPLEITHFATYWKATSQLDSYPAAFITGSSLSGEYVRLYVQTTRDGEAVLYPTWTVKISGLDIPIGRLTLAEFKSIGAQRSAPLTSVASSRPVDVLQLSDMHKLLATSFSTLGEALDFLAPDVHVEIHALFPTPAQEIDYRLEPTPNLNSFADAILKKVFDHTRHTREKTPDFMRSIVFSSYNPDLCTALNWKQPNYPVFLCNDLGRDSTLEGAGGSSTTVQSSGHLALSIKEAVRIAQSNNFMGLVCISKLLDMVPALIESVKVAGLVLVADTASLDQEDQSKPAQSLKDGVDGVLHGNGILRFNETIDM
ncbi:MAG: phosphate system positive regulatory protein pho81 [Vezdaea aestivalis]|nr:MAG: phosphate system positive regulatory protein pho81 [Vezdaea aestivalis]